LNRLARSMEALVTMASSNCCSSSALRSRVRLRHSKFDQAVVCASQASAVTGRVPPNGDCCAGDARLTRSAARSHQRAEYGRQTFLKRSDCWFDGAIGAARSCAEPSCDIEQFGDIGETSRSRKALARFQPTSRASAKWPRRHAGFAGAARELGAATDPEEGGALGVALVDHFRAGGRLR